MNDTKELIPQNRDICVECGDTFPKTDFCRIDGLCFYCCKHEPFPDGGVKGNLVQ